MKDNNDVINNDVINEDKKDKKLDNDQKESESFIGKMLNAIKNESLIGKILNAIKKTILAIFGFKSDKYDKKFSSKENEFELDENGEEIDQNIQALINAIDALISLIDNKLSKKDHNKTNEKSQTIDELEELDGKENDTLEIDDIELEDEMENKNPLEQALEALANAIQGVKESGDIGLMNQCQEQLNSIQSQLGESLDQNSDAKKAVDQVFSELQDASKTVEEKLMISSLDGMNEIDFTGVTLNENSNQKNEKFSAGIDKSVRKQAGQEAGVRGQ